ncbi:hypothetical protein ALC57_13839 [Trachymyrmex cornetzi]|uniref:Uncharacterized protein n=1 Tax=Trachymyrmex cornetzi TaxID=471704 RepID=A0A151IYY0_9HYME|nr:hypothetical protein ALC57_13839 [Trachymyrmex cornetzi]
MESAEIRERVPVPDPIRPTRCDAALRVPAFPAENGFRGAGRGAARRHSGSQPATSDGYRAPAGRPAGFNSCVKNLPAQVSFRLVSRLDDFLEQNPIDFTTKH